MNRTRRSTERVYISGGAVSQDGSLPLYVCNTCEADVVWATSRRTGRKYLVNVYRGQSGARFYVKHQPHDCPKSPTATAPSPLVQAAIFAARMRERDITELGKRVATNLIPESYRTAPDPVV